MTPKCRDKEIPSAVLHRLPRYYRCLRELIGQDRLRVRSSELAQMLGSNASQIRQDLHYFGEFGQVGYGYNVKDLYCAIGTILGVNRNYTAVIWGEHGSGVALTYLPLMKLRGVSLRAVFDSDAKETMTCSFPVLEEDRLVPFCTQNKIDILILAVGREKSATCSELLKQIPLRGVWNLSGATLSLPGVTVHDSCPTDRYFALCCEISEKQRAQERNGTP